MLICVHVQKGILELEIKKKNRVHLEWSDSLIKHVCLLLHAEKIGLVGRIF